MMRSSRDGGFAEYATAPAQDWQVVGEQLGTAHGGAGGSDSLEADPQIQSGASWDCRSVVFDHGRVRKVDAVLCCPELHRFSNLPGIAVSRVSCVGVEHGGSVPQTVMWDVVAECPLLPGVERVEELFEFVDSLLVVAPLVEDVAVHVVVSRRLVAGSKVQIAITRRSRNPLDFVEIGAGVGEGLLGGRQVVAGVPAVA